ncbi:MAG: hypothetical protein MUE81_16255 [Thermoflexibacter sp.]|nr:hypothetical protein [Thermoflexibacter sp.]
MKETENDWEVSWATNSTFSIRHSEFDIVYLLFNILSKSPKLSKKFGTFSTNAPHFTT